MSLCIFTSVCEEDAHWVYQFLGEMTRLSLPFAIHFDRCSNEIKTEVWRNHLLVGCTYQDDQRFEFNELAKQPVLDLVASNGFDWAFAMDVDETFERDAEAKIRDMQIAGQVVRADLIDVHWRTLWGSEHFHRIDSPFDVGHRTKGIYLRRPGVRWEFYHPVINGPRAIDMRGVPLPENEVKTVRFDLNILHWGMMTEELREEHRERWDRIYSKAVGNNPYGFWNLACDKSIVPALAPNPYL